MKRGRLIAALLALALTGGSLIPAAGAQTEQDLLGSAECRWAVNWINGPLATLMAHGIIETISGAEKNFQIQAGEAWGQLSFRQAGELLSNLSRARQITGHSPFFSVEQSSTGTLLGRVAPGSISVLVPGEGYVEYSPDTIEPAAMAN
jgi:hypothetical protein